ncbi:MAG: hypothetical protein HKN22_02850 [Bacteroidia bacterium]|nr:hypothetical protein [Bacteroidia bacterium]
MSGLLLSGVQVDKQVLVYIPVVLIAGFIGAHFGAGRFNNRILRSILATVLLLACAKLILT